MSLFSSLNTSYSGLQVSQAATDVISNNIANAENENYTRQRVNVVSKTPVNMPVGNIGTGAEVEQIVRIHDEFTFARYRNSSGTLEKDQFLEKTLIEVSEFFPDVDEAGLERDLNNYFDAWQKLSSNPADDSQKIVLSSNANQLSRSFNEVFSKIDSTQRNLDTQLDSAIDDVNRLAEEIASLNKEIGLAELQNYDRANTLRDERDKLEIALTKLIDPNITKTGLQRMADVNMDVADYGEQYSVMLGGYQLVDGTSFHPLKVTEDAESVGGYKNIYFEKSDFTLDNITLGVQGGKIGAMLDMRGRTFDSSSGEFEDGSLQKYKNMLDTLSKGIMQATNTVYAGSSDSYMETSTIGDTVTLNVSERRQTLINLYPDRLRNTVREGEMVISTYDISGKYIEDIKVALDPTRQDILTVIDEINTTFNAKGLDAKAVLELGTIKIKNGGTTNPTTLGAVLVKEDNSLISEALDITAYRSLDKVDELDIPFNIEDGTFSVNVYNENGTELASREITIKKTSEDPMYSTLAGIVAQINLVHLDDNGDNEFQNDVDDLITATFADNKFKISVNDQNSGLQFNITDDTTGFSGATGLHKFFDGDSAGNMQILDKFRESPSYINAYGKAVEGDNEIANKMQQLQYDTINFYPLKGETVTETIMGQYRYTTGIIASDTHIVQLQVENSQAVYDAISKQQQSISAVNIDEELTNLIMFQTGYGANAKVISSIQQMLDTLLGMKQ